MSLRSTILAGGIPYVNDLYTYNFKYDRVMIWLKTP
jgi:hypothetical protein